MTPVFLLMVLGCSDADRARSAAPVPDSTVAPPAPLAAPSGDTGSDPVTDSIVAAIRACPRDGLWHECSVVHRLESSGLRPRAVDSIVRIPGIPQDGRLWQIGRQTLRGVFFDSEAAALAAMATLDSARAAPRADSSVAWPERPTLIRSANLLALLLGGTDRQVERVSNALTAGPPQPVREE